MSWTHFQWAIKQKTGCDRANHVLQRLAYMANKKGSVVVNISDLSNLLEMPERTLKRTTSKLEKWGLITRERRVNSRGHRSTNKYTIQRATVAPRNARQLHPPTGQIAELGQGANVARPLTTTVVSTMKTETFIDTYPLGNSFQVVGDAYRVSGSRYVCLERQQ